MMDNHDIISKWGQVIEKRSSLLDIISKWGQVIEKRSSLLDLIITYNHRRL